MSSQTSALWYVIPNQSHQALRRKIESVHTSCINRDRRPLYNYTCRVYRRMGIYFGCRCYFPSSYNSYPYGFGSGSINTGLIGPCIN